MPESKKDSKCISLQIKAIANVIKGKEKQGVDATFERNLLKEWAKYEGWELAGTILHKPQNRCNTKRKR